MLQANTKNKKEILKISIDDLKFKYKLRELQMSLLFIEIMASLWLVMQSYLEF